MLVAFLTNHLTERVLPQQREGGLRVRREHRGALDHARHARARANGRSTTPPTSSFPFDPKKALLVTAIVGIGGAALFLLAFWRPPKQDRPRKLTETVGGRAAWDGSRSSTSRSGSTDVAAVDDLTLDVADEEFLVLLGPSGCGKSTALRMIAGLEDPTEARSRIGDRVVNDVEAKDRDIAMVFQSYALYPHMTVRRNIEFPLRVAQGARRPSAPSSSPTRPRASASTACSTASPRSSRAASASGSRWPRAIVRRPQAFLMDEPLSNLDAKLRVQTRAELVELQRRLAATIVYVTHDQVEAMTMGHRIAVLDAGVLQQVGPPQDVYARAGQPLRRPLHRQPADEHRRPARVDRVDGALVVAVPGGPGTARPPSSRTRSRRRGSTSVVLGVRPEDLRLGDDGGVTATVARRRVARPRAPRDRAGSPTGSW